MIWHALNMISWWEYLLAIVAAQLLAWPIGVFLGRRDEQRAAENAAAYAEFMRVRR